MEELVLQNDGCYAVCFKNFNEVSIEEVENIFKNYGDVCSIRQSAESIPWVFIRYKLREEAQKALDDLQGSKDIDLQIAKSRAKKKQDHDGERERSDFVAECPRDNMSIKGFKKRNSEKFSMDCGDCESVDTKESPNRGPFNRKYNSFAERSNRNKNDDCNHSERVDEVEGARALFSRTDLTDFRNKKIVNEKHFRGREDAENFRKSFDKSPPRLVKKSPGNQWVNGAGESRKQPGCGPPKLVKGSEYYGSVRQSNSVTSGLALRAAYNEVLANHPLLSEVQLREVLMTNFDYMPSKRDIYKFCLPVKPLHVSFGMTKSESVYCRVLVLTEDDVRHLCDLSSDEVFVTTTEDLLDYVFDE